MDKRATWVLIFIFGGLFVVVFGFLGLTYMVVREGGQGDDTASFASKSGIGVIELKGQIGDTEKQVKAFRKFVKDDNVKAIVLRVDSPGGSVAPSQEVHDEVLRAIKHDKPVVVSMGSLAASGGYYASCAATKIFAEPGTLTASIGVIMEVADVSSLMERFNLQMNVIKTGALKDSGSPYRHMTEDDRKYFTDVAMNIYEQFLKAVADGRKLKVEDVRPIADGRVLTGQQAKEKGLIDELGSFSDAVEEAQKLGKLEGEPHLIYPSSEKEGFLREILKDGASTFAHVLVETIHDEIDTKTAGPQFLMPIPTKAE